MKTQVFPILSMCVCVCFCFSFWPLRIVTILRDQNLEINYLNPGNPGFSLVPTMLISCDEKHNCHHNLVPFQWLTNITRKHNRIKMAAPYDIRSTRWHVSRNIANKASAVPKHLGYIHNCSTYVSFKFYTRIFIFDLLTTCVATLIFYGETGDWLTGEIK